MVLGFFSSISSSGVEAKFYIFLNIIRLLNAGVVKFSFFSEPIALGTALFASTFLCTDILAEHYGTKKARINVLIGFAGFLFMTLLMLFSLGFQPLDSTTAGENYTWALNIQNNLLGIFLPFPTNLANLWTNCCRGVHTQNGSRGPQSLQKYKNHPEASSETREKS